MVKNGCGQSCHGTLRLTVPQEWNGMNWFFYILVQIQES